MSERPRAENSVFALEHGKFLSGQKGDLRQLHLTELVFWKEEIHLLIHGLLFDLAAVG